MREQRRRILNHAGVERVRNLVPAVNRAVPRAAARIRLRQYRVEIEIVEMARPPAHLRQKLGPSDDLAQRCRPQRH